MSTLLAADLSAACSALGHYDGNRYYPDDQCLETTKDLMRFLRRDDATHEMRRLMGNSQVLQSDLLPLMKETANQPELFNVTLRLIVNLTNPALMLYKDTIPNDKIERNHFLQIIGHLQQYKQGFAEDRCQVWDVIREKMNEILQIDVSERDEDQSVLVERCLILVRNMLNVPTDPTEEKRPDNDANVHDKLLWSLHTSGIKLIILYLASNKAEHAYYMYVLEIMSLMLREQNPEVLASAHFNRSEREKERDEKALAAVTSAEQKAKLLKLRNAAGSRHSRFGGTFTVRGMKAIGEEDLVVHRHVKSVKTDIDFDLDKKLRKTPKNKCPIIEESCERRSAFTIRLMLKEFCVEFLSGAYNYLMSTVKGILDRQAAQANDETYYLWAIKFFMEFNRHYGFKVELVSETMNVSMFHFISVQIDTYREQMKLDKPRAKLWAARLHVALRAYGELLLTLCAMDKDPNPSVRNSSKIFKGNIFYLAEYREILLSLLIDYNEVKFSDRFLKDLIESTHVFLKLLETFCTSRSLLLVQNVRKKPAKKKKKPPPPPIIPREQQWLEMSETLVGVIATSEIDPGSYSPFDATLNRDIDDQKADAMCKVQTLLRKRKLMDAVGTLRASREIWPENDIFGGANMTPEEELEAMHEIFQANIQLDEPTTPPPAESDSEEEGSRSPQMVSSEKSFNFKEFVNRYAHDHVIRSCGLLLRRFQSNSVFTNHCICKLLHRVAFTLKLPIMLFQVSLFMTFQKIMRSKDHRHKELIQFVRYIIGQLKLIADKNQTVFREMPFWKTRRAALHIESGVNTVPTSSSTLKQAWAEEEEQELHRLYEEYHAVRPAQDLSSWILNNLVRKDRSKNSLNKKLREFGYLAPKKDHGPPPPEEWAPEEEAELREQYDLYKDVEDPISWIMLSLTVRRRKTAVINKMLELGLITNKNQVQKDKDQPGPVVYKSAEFVDTDDSSSSDEEEQSVASTMLPWPQQQTQIKQCAELCKQMDGAKSLAWLVDGLKMEAEERRNSLDDPDTCDALLLPDDTEISAHFETDAFKDLFTSMGLVQEVFLKIPGKMPIRRIVDMAAEIQKVLSPQAPPFPRRGFRPVSDSETRDCPSSSLIPRDDHGAAESSDEDSGDNVARRGSEEGSSVEGSDISETSNNQAAKILKKGRERTESSSSCDSTKETSPIVTVRRFKPKRRSDQRDEDRSPLTKRSKRARLISSSESEDLSDVSKSPNISSSKRANVAVRTLCHDVVVPPADSGDKSEDETSGDDWAGDGFKAKRSTKKPSAANKMGHFFGGEENEAKSSLTATDINWEECADIGGDDLLPTMSLKTDREVDSEATTVRLSEVRRRLQRAEGSGQGSSDSSYQIPDPNSTEELSDSVAFRHCFSEWWPKLFTEEGLLLIDPRAIEISSESEELQNQE